MGTKKMNTATKEPQALQQGYGALGTCVTGPQVRLGNAMTPSATSAANKGFMDDGPVVSRPNDIGDNGKTHGNCTRLCVRALQQPLQALSK